MIVLGVTGSLASGKSEAARILKELGAEIFDADRSARAVSKKGTPIHQAIVRLFGKDILKKSGVLDRRKLALRVFSNPKELKELQVLIHPGVIFDCMNRISRLKDRRGVLVLDVPLLFESKMEKLADKVLVIAASERTIRSRAKNRGYSPELMRNILKSQWPIKKKEALADFVIQNNGTLNDLEKKVKRVYQLITGGSK